MDLAPMEGPEQVPTELRFKPFIYSKQGRITEGQRVQLPRALRSKGAPRDDICLFQMKYSLKKLLLKRDTRIQTLYTDVALSIINDFSASLTFCHF